MRSAMSVEVEEVFREMLLVINPQSHREYVRDFKRLCDNDFIITRNAYCRQA